MYIYLIRHGETNYNVEKRHQGMWGESVLTENGIAQAEALRNTLKGLTFDKIYCSAAVRTRQTCAAAFPDRNDVMFFDDLREIDTGSLTHITMAEAEEKYGDLYRTHRVLADYSPFGGESPADALHRGKTVFDRFVAGGGERVAVVTHGTFLHFVMFAALEIPPFVRKVRCDNTSITVLQVKEGNTSLALLNYIPDPFQKLF